ncbi:MAG: hypothetical protein ACLRIS_09235 [Flavonifractor plautii]
MALLPEIVEAFHGLELARRGGARCVLTCVHPLEAEELRSSGGPVPSPPQEGDRL